MDSVFSLVLPLDGARFGVKTVEVCIVGTHQDPAVGTVGGRENFREGLVRPARLPGFDVHRMEAAVFVTEKDGAAHHAAGSRNAEHRFVDPLGLAGL